MIGGAEKHSTDEREPPSSNPDDAWASGTALPPRSEWPMVNDCPRHVDSSTAARLKHDAAQWLNQWLTTQNKGSHPLIGLGRYHLST
jgi:hypothetical protein